MDGPAEAERDVRPRPVILHLSIDYNDPHRARTTTAVEWLVAELTDYDNVVISMTRKSDPRAAYMIDCGQEGHIRLFAFGYFGLPFGVGHLPSMWAAARRIRKALDAAGLRPDLVHAHKFAFEGLSGWLLSRAYGVPLFVSLRGEVETKIFRYKPTLRPLLRRIARDAARVYHVSAWFRDEFHRHVPERPDERLLPNIVRNAQPRIRSTSPGENFVTVLNLDIWKKKGFHTLIAGFKEAGAARAFGLDVVGGGSTEAQEMVRAIVRRAGLESRVRFLGRISNDELLARLPTWRALLLPSLNETFGMIYVEALFAGIPILYTRGTGIDGYLDGLDVGVAVAASDPLDVARAMLRLDAEAEAFRRRFVAAGGVLYERLGKEPMLKAYLADIAEALAVRS